jgi:three-Cys-motif partner protein
LGSGEISTAHLVCTIILRLDERQGDCLVYIDLFAGSGRSRIKGTSRIVAGSPLIALDVYPPFDHYILCEKNKEKLQALETRVRRDYSRSKVAFQAGDANEFISQILDTIPKHRQGFRVLSFCFVDPYNLGDLSFDTIDRLSDRFIDFLVLIATDMDASRNISKYEMPANSTVERFPGCFGVERRVGRSKGERRNLQLLSDGSLFPSDGGETVYSCAH